MNDPEPRPIDLADPADPFYDLEYEAEPADVPAAGPFDVALEALIRERVEGPGGEPDDAPAGATFVAVCQGSVDGFSLATARGVLSDPQALKHLEVLWALRPPAEQLIRLAKKPDARGLAHRELLIRTGQLSDPVPAPASGWSTAASPVVRDGPSSEESTVIGPRRPQRSRLRRRISLGLVAASVASLLVVTGVVGVRLSQRQRIEPAAPAATVSATAAPSRADLPASDPLRLDQFVVPIGSSPGTARLYVSTAVPGAALQRLRPPNGHGVASPTLSLDRRSLIYLDSTTGEARTSAVDGSGDRLLFAQQVPGCERIGHVAWNPADQQVLVVRCMTKAGPSKLLVTTVAGEVQREIKTDYPSVDDPTISPDGRTVLFWGSNDLDSEGGAILTAPLDGSAKPVQITASIDGRDADAAWSPDGSTIVFRRRDSANNYDLFLMSPSGADVRRLVGGTARDYKPAWSPDGSQLLFVSNRDSDGLPTAVWDLFLLQADGTGLQGLGIADKRVLTPVWSRR